MVILASFDIDPNEAITFMEGIKEKVYIVTAYYTVVVASVGVPYYFIIRVCI